LLGRQLERPEVFLIFTLSVRHFYVRVTCPFCGESASTLSDPRFGYCKTDRLVVNHAYEAVRYEDDYFNKEYKAQYGRSYTADRQAILQRNQHRYDKVRHLFTPHTHPQVLEIGSAAGYFLKAMQEADFIVRGWEISRIMAEFANARGLKTTRQDFLKGARSHLKKKAKPFDIVAMFYVLEHIKEQREAWDHLANLVRPGGYLLLALPSSTGPMFRFHRADWYSSHPGDHIVDYSPRALKGIGDKFGFTLREAYSEGIHPDRFPLGSFSPMRNLYKHILSTAPLSDTIFAVLERN
jgi:SAM-dependent methyltransferase